MTEWVEVAKEDLEEIHDLAEEIHMKGDRLNHWGISNRGQEIKDMIEADKFYKPEEDDSDD